MTRRPPKKFVFTQGKDRRMEPKEKPITIAGSGDFELWTEKALMQRRLAKLHREQRAAWTYGMPGSGEGLLRSAEVAEREAERIEAALDAYAKERQAGETYKG